VERFIANTSAKSRKNHTWCAKYRSGFMTLPPMPLQEQPVIDLLLERNLVYWSLAMNEHGELKDLFGLGRRSVIPCVHGRMELYYSSLALPM
jgi:hypothetical protein